MEKCLQLHGKYCSIQKSYTSTPLTRTSQGLGLPLSLFCCSMLLLKILHFAAIHHQNETNVTNLETSEQSTNRNNSNPGHSLM